VITTKACQWGIGRHIYYLAPEQIMNALKYSVFLVGPLNLCVILGRASICLFLLSAIGTEPRVRILLWAALISQAIVGVFFIILQYSSCGSHLTAIWDLKVHAKCISYHTMIKFIYFAGAWNAFIDLFITIIPAVMLKGLQLPLKKKVVVIILLCISGFAFIASLLKCILTGEMKKPDVTYSIGRLNFLIMAEAYVIIIVGSVPLLNSLVKWGKETITHYSSEGSRTAQTEVTVKQSWTVEHEDAEIMESSDQGSKGYV